MYKVETRGLDGYTTQTDISVVYEYAVKSAREAASQSQNSEAVVYRLSNDGEWDPCFVHNGIFGHIIPAPWERRDIEEEQAQ